MKTEIVLLGVLHNFHNNVDCYDLNALEKLIASIKPSVICVELDDDEVKNRKEQPYKIEYQSIFSYADSNNIEIVGIDPQEPLYSELVEPYNDNQKDFPERAPEACRVLEIQQSQLYDFLINEYWTKLSNVHSSQTEDFLNLKHRFQEALMGPAEKDGWDRFNKYYVEQIISVANENQGKRILVTIGIEHIYWLRNYLRDHSDYSLPRIDCFI